MSGAWDGGRVFALVGGASSNLFGGGVKGE